MARLNYQQTGYTGANVTHQAATQTTNTESFNKANGALGPDLTWTRQVLFGAFDLQVVSNQMEFFTNSVGTHEDFRVPTPNVDHPDVTMTLDVTEMTRTGAAATYLIGLGFAARLTILAGGTQYDAYTAELYKTTVFGPDLYVLTINRLHSYPGGVATSLATATATVANVTLPGVLTFTATGPNLSASFTHGGPGGTLTVNTTDNVFETGTVAFGCSNTVNGTDTCKFRVDNWSVTEAGDVLPVDDRGILWIKNTGGVDRTVTIAIPGATFGQANPDSAVTIPASSERLIGPIAPEIGVGTSRRAAVTYSNVAGLSVAAVRVATPPPDLP